MSRVFGQRDPSGFIPSPLDRYRQILLPALRLFQVILTSTTTHHQQGAAQVLQWLIVHADTIQGLLRCQELSMGALQELSLLTGIISKTALPGTHTATPGTVTTPSWGTPGFGTNVILWCRFCQCQFCDWLCVCVCV